MIPISRNPCSDIQRFYQDLRLPNYSLDTFSGRLFDVVSSTTFVTSNVQTELHHAITRLIVSAYVFKYWFNLKFFFIDIYWFFLFFFRFLIMISSFMYRLFDIYKPVVCHFIDCEASLGNVSPPLDPSHPACEIIRGDTQWLRSNFLWVYCVYFSLSEFYLIYFLFQISEFSMEGLFWLNFSLIFIFCFFFFQLCFTDCAE